MLIPYLPVSAQQDPVPIADISIAAGSPSSSNVVELLSDSSGQASVQLIPGVNHYVTASARGYAPKTVSIDSPSAGQNFNVNVELDPLPMVEGYITTPDGRPVAGAVIFSSVETAISDERGYYALYVSPNDTDISVMAPFQFFVPGEIINQSLGGDVRFITIFNYNIHNGNVVSKNVNLSITGPTTRLDVTLDWSARLTGTVTYQNGTPAANLRVSAFATGSTQIVGFPSGYTGDDGRYVIERDLLNGNYNISISMIRGSSILSMPNVASVSITCAPPCSQPDTADLVIPNIVRITGQALSCQRLVTIHRTNSQRRCEC